MNREHIMGADLSVEIVDIALPDNYGVAKKDGYLIFVPEAVPGDRVKVKILRENKRFAYAEMLHIEKPSPFRTSAECPHTGTCGGCTLQHIGYEKQLEIKDNHLLQTLARIGGVDVGGIEIMPIMPSPDRFFYRNKLELAFGEKQGHIILGLRERVSPFKAFTGKVIPIEKCLIFSPAIAKIIPLFIECAETYSLTPYDSLTKSGFLRHLILREAKFTGELMVILETTKGELPDLTKLWRKLIEQVPETKSFYRVVNNRQGDVENYERQYHLFGKPYIEEILDGLLFRIYPQSFFQPNTKASKLLYHKIIELSQLQKDERVLGLYCGMGPIEMFVSRTVKEVAGIDSNPVNIVNARENCRLNGIGNCLFYEGKIEHAFKNISPAKVDCVVIDPPRRGISREGLKHIFTLSPPKVVYVSCNPSTLARDIKSFREHNYFIRKIASFDFFPHTSHLETLVIFGKN